MILRIVLISNLALALAVLATRLLGGVAQPSFAVQAFHCSPEPCWPGVKIGQTSVSDVQRLILANPQMTVTYNSNSQLCWRQGAPGFSVCYRHIVGSNTGEIDLIDPPSPFHEGPLTIGDAIAIFGEPIGFKGCTRGPVYPVLLNITLRFARGVELVGEGVDVRYLRQLPQSKWGLRILPSIKVMALIYSTDPMTDYRQWRGFSRIDYYVTC